MQGLSPSIQTFIDYLKYEKRFSRHTLRAYADDLNQCAAFLGSQYDVHTLDGVSALFVRSWMAALKESGVTSRTINRKLSTLKSFFKYMIRIGQLQQSPLTTVISPKLSKRLPAFAPEKELLELIEGLQYTEDWKGLNARLIFTLLYSTGMRLSELLALYPRDFNSSNLTVKVLGKGGRQRLIPVAPQVMALVEDYQQRKKTELAAYDDALLVNEKGRRVYPKYVYLLVNTYLAQIKTLEKKSPHILRHSFATHLTNHGAELNAVKELLGHSSLAATQVYTHNSIEKLRQVYHKAHPRERKP